MIDHAPTVIVRFGDERARVYAEGGIGFDRYLKGIGWVVCDRPGRLISKYAMAVRKLHAASVVV